MDIKKISEHVKNALNCISQIRVNGQATKLMALAIQDLENALSELTTKEEEKSNG